MAHPNLIEDHIVELAQQGDEAASRMIIERMHSPLRGFLYRLLGSGFSNDFDDIEQDILLKVFRTIGRFDKSRGVKFSTWVFTYARNHCVDLLKKKRLPTVDLEGVSDSGFAGLLPDERAVQPLRALESVEIGERIEAARSRLPRDHRLALTHRDAGEEYVDIAARLGVAPGTIKSRLHRARIALRRELAQFDPAPSAA